MNAAVIWMVFELDNIIIELFKAKKFESCHAIFMCKWIKLN